MNTPAHALPLCPGFALFESPFRALRYGTMRRASEVSEEYVADTGRHAQVVPVGRDFALVDAGRYVGRDATNTYTFKNRPKIRTDRDPITANDYREGRMPADIARMWYHDDLAFSFGAQPWVEVVEAQYPLAQPTGEVCLLIRRAGGQPFARYVAPDHVLFGERK